MERCVPKVVYVLRDGSERRIEVPEGDSVMLGAILNDVSGIDGECGGCCSCGTCHVYVDEAYLAKLGPPDPSESALLEHVAAERRRNSRLSCQITMAPALDGLVVSLPERQG
jgi:ferredoxin, 2Fe-2S